MRVTRIAGDFHDIGDKPCRVYLNETEILDWTVADDFRRVVETPAGARFGAVLIDMRPEAEKPAEEVATHLCGVFVAEAKPEPEPPAVEVVEAAAQEPGPAVAPTYAAPKVAVKPAATRKKRGR